MMVDRQGQRQIFAEKRVRGGDQQRLPGLEDRRFTFREFQEGFEIALRKTLHKKSVELVALARRKNDDLFSAENLLQQRGVKIPTQGSCSTGATQIEAPRGHVFQCRTQLGRRLTG